MSRPKIEKPRDKSLTIRFTTLELAAIVHEARVRGEPTGAFVRRMINLMVSERLRVRHLAQEMEAHELEAHELAAQFERDNPETEWANIKSRVVSNLTNMESKIG